MASQKNNPWLDYLEKLNANQKFRLYLGLFFMLFSFYLAVTIVSYLFTWDYDQDLLRTSLAEHPMEQAKNPGGKMGNILGEYLVSKGFGLAAIGIPFLIACLSVLLAVPKRFRLLKAIIGLSIGIPLLSLMLGYFSGDLNIAGGGLGGAHGYAIGKKWLPLMIGPWGTFLVLTGGFLMYIVYLAPTTHQWLVRLGNRVAGIFERKSKTETANAQDVETYPIENQTVVMEDELTEEELTEDDLKDEDLWVDDEPLGDSALETDLPSPTEETNGTDELLIQIDVPEKDADASQEVIESKLFDPTSELSKYKKPTLNLLAPAESVIEPVSKLEVDNNKQRIIRTLKDYGVEISSISVTVGPTVTLYEIVPSPGVKISKIKNLEDDIALSLSALGIRIIAPIPGRGTIGIEVPNSNPVIVPMADVIRSAKFQESHYELPIVMGRTITNEAFTFDLTKMPHLLVAGATGQGKSVGLNVILTSLLYKKHPSELKFVMVDPKKVELSLYSRLNKHFLAMLPDGDEPIITDTQKVIFTLNSLCKEMDERYTLLQAAETRNIKEYNEKFINRRLNPKNGHRFLPYIVVVIDEFADMIMTAGREIETPIARLAQLARAIGIHLVIATQRPDANIITGLIRANFPARIAFRVQSSQNSRIILDAMGAHQLIGRGDMLISLNGEITRVQCALIDTPEVERVTEFIQNQRGFELPYYLPEWTPESAEGASSDFDLNLRDAMFERAAQIVVGAQQGSTSLLQRKLSVGHARAGRLMDQLEASGIVGPSEGSKPRQVYFQDVASLEAHINLLSQS